MHSDADGKHSGEIAAEWPRWTNSEYWTTDIGSVTGNVFSGA